MFRGAIVMTTAGLFLVASCTAIVDSDGLSDEYGVADALAETTTEPFDGADASEIATDSRPPDPPDTTECDSREYAGHAYLVCRSFGNWNRARTTCSSYGEYSLVAIDDAAEQDVVDKLLAGRGDVWIGLADDLEEGKYRWSNGTMLGGYTNWASVEPSGESMAWEDCVAMGANGFWYDHDCSSNFNYIACESK